MHGLPYRVMSSASYIFMLLHYYLYILCIICCLNADVRFECV